MIARFAQSHPLYPDNNTSLYEDMSAATRGAQYVSIILFFKKTKYGQEAFPALISQFASKTVFNKDKKKSTKLLLNEEWNGMGTYDLQRYLNWHHFTYAGLKRCSNYVSTQFPGKKTCVQYLMDNIHINHVTMKAALESVHLDDKVDEDGNQTDL